MPIESRLDPYEILSAIGAGGTGEVYCARDTRLDRTVAIKILPEAFARDAGRSFANDLDAPPRAAQRAIKRSTVPGSNRLMVRRARRQGQMEPRDSKGPGGVNRRDPCGKRSVQSWLTVVVSDGEEYLMGGPRTR